ncbi:MAG: phosphoribosylaminoimidazolesuccinocarboxamide synthase [Armatimonadetes bacterium]|nr:phosphoribosylaminoimidazolesuccinocarboxamide synthase [Armatimonadota bacterium]
MSISDAPAVVATDLPLPVFARGKVRDVYDLGERLLIVATDRLSAFDHVLPTPVPGKGRILTRLSAFWFARTRKIVQNHLIATDIDQMRLPPAVGEQVRLLDGRAMLVRRANRIDVECVVRGYLTGSGWQEYSRDGAVCGVRLPDGLAHGARLPHPIFTPATKAASGHDQNIAFEEVARLVGGTLAERMRDLSLALYLHAAAVAERCGLLLADTKFEFGMVRGASGGAGGDALMLIDEALTPDSSRYWDAAEYTAGRLASFDKQIVRDYLTRTGWNRESPAPALSDDVVEATRQRYLETYRRLTGEGIA